MPDFQVFSRTEPLNKSVLGVYCELEADYHQKFLYFDKDDRIKLVGLGCVASWDHDELYPYDAVGSIRRAPVLFSAGPFDPADARPTNDLFSSLGADTHVLPEVVLIEEAGRTYVQINSAHPVGANALDRIASLGADCAFASRPRPSIPYRLAHYSGEEWVADVEAALARIREGAFDKIVLARESRVEPAGHTRLSSRDMVLNLIHGNAHGTLFLYQANGTFFLGATPELLVRKQGATVTTMCLAGTISMGDTEQERDRAAQFLLSDEKNLREHAYVVEHLRSALAGITEEMTVPEAPVVLRLRHVQHLFTPISGQLRDGISLIALRDRLHPTPALAGYPVDAATAAIRQMEQFNRGLYGGTFGYLDLDGNGEFSVAIRSGVFAEDHGYVYAGCGIVEGSDPATEHAELDDKLKTILTAFQGESDG